MGEKARHLKVVRLIAIKSRLSPFRPSQIYPTSTLPEHAMHPSVPMSPVLSYGNGDGDGESVNVRRQCPYYGMFTMGWDCFSIRSGKVR